MPQTFNNVREFVVNALKQYHQLQLEAELGVIQSQLENYVEKEEGKGLSTNDFTNAYLAKLSTFFDYANYDSVNHNIIFKNGGASGTQVASIDCSSFIIDGMVDSVSIENYNSTDAETYGTSYLFIDFNTVSGKSDIKIPIKDIFDSNNYYTKSDIDQIIDDSEEVTAASLNDLNNRINAINSYGYITSAALENIDMTAKEDIANKVTDLSNSNNISNTYYPSTSAVASYIASTYTYLVDKIIEDEEVTATSISYIHSYISNLSELTTAELNSIFL